MNRPISLARITLLVAALVALFAPASTSAQAQTGLCAVDVTPAGTLLFPEIAVDVDDPTGLNTILTIANASPNSVLAQVVQWSDVGVPVLNFSVYLTGWDVVTWDLSDAIHVGNVPRTGLTVSPHGPLSQPADEASAPACNGLFPYDNPAIGPALRQRMRAGLTGEPSDFDSGLCLGSPRSLETRSAGTITIDVTTQCYLGFPDDKWFYRDVASNESVLVGSYRVVDPTTGRTIDRPAVHLEADSSGFLRRGDRTFAQRWLLPGDPLSFDGREPLPSRWAVRFDGSEESVLHVWRSGEAAAIEPFDCKTLPEHMPLTTEPLLVFDDAENPLEIQINLQYEVNTVDLDATLPLEGAGWIALDLRHERGLAEIGDRAQSFVHVVSGSTGAVSTSDGWPLDDNCPAYTLEAFVPLFVDGFESGDFTAWN